MPKPENNSANENENSGKNNEQENSNSQNAENENSDSPNANNENTNSQQTVPLATFLKQKDELKELKDKFSKIEEQERQAKEEKLKEEGKLKELLDAKESELERLKSEYEPDALAYREIKKTELEQVKRLLGSDWTDDMENIPLPTLRRLVDKKYPDKAPDTDGSGIKVNISKLVEKLTDKEKKEAARMNISEETYVELKLEREKKKGK